MQRLMAEAYRLHLIRGVDRLLQADGIVRIAGVDEAGRGCLAGPVVAAAVIVDPACLVAGVDDSKRLLEPLREELSSAIQFSSKAWAVSSVPAAEIDRGNILRATKEAMVRCLARLKPQPQCAVIDAVALDLSYPSLCLFRAETLSYSVACASILAKVARDRMMRRFDRLFPAYGFASNKGYGALEHREALRRFGPSPIHRLTFKSVVPRRAA